MEKFGCTIWRIKRYLREQGFIALCKQVAMALWRIAFQNRNVIFCLDLSRSSDNINPGLPHLETYRYDHLEDVPHHLLDQLRLSEGAGIIYAFDRCFARGASLWIAKIGNNIVAYQHVISGDKLANWFLPVTKNDCVIFSMVTLRDYRGRGLSPALIQQVVTSLGKDGTSRMFVDCKMWNAASIRAVTKVGFKSIGIARRWRLFGKNVVIWSGQESNNKIKRLWSKRNNESKQDG